MLEHKKSDFLNGIEKTIERAIMSPNCETTQTGADYLLIDELPYHITISFYKNGKTTYLNCKKSVILDKQSHTDKCENQNCQYCHLKDSRNSLLIKEIGTFVGLFENGYLKEFVRGYVEYFMLDQKIALAFYAPKPYDLVRSVYPQSILERCQEGYDSLTTYRQVNFLIVNAPSRRPIGNIEN